MRNINHFSFQSVNQNKLKPVRPWSRCAGVTATQSEKRQIAVSVYLPQQAICACAGSNVVGWARVTSIVDQTANRPRWPFIRSLVWFNSTLDAHSHPHLDNGIRFSIFQTAPTAVRGRREKGWARNRLLLQRSAAIRVYSHHITHWPSLWFCAPT